MFAECEMEVTVKDKTLSATDDYTLKLWLQRSFKANCCYRISNFKLGEKATFRAVVALNTRVLADVDWRRLEQGKDAVSLKSFMESMFEGKGVCRCIGQPQLRAS